MISESSLFFKFISYSQVFFFSEPIKVLEKASLEIFIKKIQQNHSFKLNLFQGFQTVQELIFIKLNEQMRAVQPDKSKADEIKEELKQQITVST